MKLKVDALAAYRTLAYTRIDEHYCTIARQNAYEYHVALLDVARGKRTDHPLDEHERTRAELRARIGAAKSKAEVDTVLETIGL